MSVYEYSYTSLEGKDIPMMDYEGKVLLLVNTASKCGFTPQYEGLEALYKAHKDEGFSVIGFPSGQFNDQEFDTAGEIEEFCKVRYGVTFPLSKKVEVRGETPTPLFKYLTENTTYDGLGEGIVDEKFETLLKNKYGEQYGDSQIKWNFTKFLIDKQGNIVRRYESSIVPAEIESDIKAELAK